MSGETTFSYVTYIAASAEKVWSALTGGEFTEKYWFGFRIQSDWTAGAKVEIRPPAAPEEAGEAGVAGKVIACEWPRRLSYTFEVAGDPNAGQRAQPSRVTFDLKAFGPVVRLTLTHEHLVPADVERSPETLRGVNNGWPAILAGLKTLLETNAPLDMSGAIQAMFPEPA
jgi:uncharacterized protein YndB with AHSA1/START domain